METVFGKRSRAKENILNSLLKGEKTLSRLSKEIGVSKQTTLSHLNELEEKGMVKSRSRKKEESGIRIKTYKIQSFSTLISIKATETGGYAVSFQSDAYLNPKFPLLNQVPQLEYREDMEKYLEGIKKIEKPITVTLFGSVARGQATWKSDIDAAIFSNEWTKEEKDDFLDKISEVNTKGEVRTSLNPHFKKYKSKDKITERIYEEGLIIHTNKKGDQLWKKMKKYRSI